MASASKKQAAFHFVRIGDGGEIDVCVAVQEQCPVVRKSSERQIVERHANAICLRGQTMPWRSLSIAPAAGGDPVNTGCGSESSDGFMMASPVFSSYLAARHDAAGS